MPSNRRTSPDLAAALDARLALVRPVRPEVVRRVRHALEVGTLPVPAEQLADRLLRPVLREPGRS
jgi:hypothetical protein